MVKMAFVALCPSGRRKRVKDNRIGMGQRKRGILVQQQTHVRILAQGALLAALTVVIAVAGFFIPMLGFVTAFVLPLPVVVMQLRHGLRAAVLAAVASGAVLVMLIGPVEGILLFSFYGIIGLTFGFAMRRDYQGVWAVLVGSGAVAVVTVISLTATFLIVGLSPVEFFRQSLGALEAAMEMYENWGVVQPDMARQMTAMIDDALANLQYIIPGSLLAASAIVSFLCYQVARSVLRRLGHIVRPVPPFSTWQAPDYLVFVPILGVLSVATQAFHGQEFLVVIGANLAWIGQLYFLIQGLSVMSFYLKRYQMPVIIQVLMGWIIVTTGFLLQVTVFAAMFDSLLDFRRLRSPTTRREQ